MTAPPLHLPDVTLVAVTSVNVDATIHALQASMRQARFAGCKLFTDAAFTAVPKGITIVPIPRVTSARDYSAAILNCVVGEVNTGFCMVCQWDGYVLNPALWTDEFLLYDYVGAGWPQFEAGRDVGNGGFSLRSRRLLELCASDDFVHSHPEDLAICHRNRDWLESEGIAFAPRALADRFSAERCGRVQDTFGFHGVWHMPQILGAAEFWDLYKALDERGTIWHDFSGLLRQIAKGKGGMQRSLNFVRHRLAHAGLPGR
jgi:hypothetical protein